MVKTNSKNRRRTHHPAVTLVVIGILIGVLFFVSKMLADNASDVTEESKRDTNTTKVEKTEKTPTENQTTSDNGDNKTPIQNDGDDPNAMESLTGVITMAELSNGMVRIRVNIDQYLASGTCKLDMRSNSGTTFTDSAIIIPSSSTSTCEGFDIPVLSLSSGHWNININLESNNKTGTITGDINI